MSGPFPFFLSSWNDNIYNTIYTFSFGPGFDTLSGHILSFLIPLIQEGQLSVTGESMCTKYWLTGLSLPRKRVVRLTDHPDMTLDVYRGRKTTTQQRFLFFLFMPP